LLTEAIAESLDNNESLYGAFIDASKAFDVGTVNLNGTNSETKIVILVEI
jgi:hypothetical protein